MKMTPIEEKNRDEIKPKAATMAKPSASQGPNTSNKNKTPNTIINKSNIMTKPAPLTKSNVTKFSMSQSNSSNKVSKQKRAWDDDSAVDFSKMT